VRPDRGEVWIERPVRGLRGHEQQGQRPVVVVSAAAINRGAWKLSLVVPLTRRDRGMALHVPIEVGEGGLRARSFALPEQLHAVSHERLIERWGHLSMTTMREIDDRLRIALDLD
jgi:mRNA-degrading endonuclease toxin of MazEF toxin-antitoxin module